MAEGLEALPPAQRQVVVRFYADLSVAGIAQALEIPEGTVKSRLHSAHEKGAGVWGSTRPLLFAVAAWGVDRYGAISRSP